MIDSGPAQLHGHLEHWSNALRGQLLVFDDPVELELPFCRTAHQFKLST
jgi:hypothetical protein